MGKVGVLLRGGQAEALAQPADYALGTHAGVIHGGVHIGCPILDGKAGELLDVPRQQLTDGIDVFIEYRLHLQAEQKIAFDDFSRAAQKIILVFRHFQQRGQHPMGKARCLGVFAAQEDIHRRLVKAHAARLDIMQEERPLAAGEAVHGRMLIRILR